jgi:hypothetical protein
MAKQKKAAAYQIPTGNKKWPCVQGGGYNMRGFALYDLSKPHECVWNHDLQDAPQVSEACRTSIAVFGPNYQDMNTGFLKWWASPAMCNVKVYAPGAELPPPPIGTLEEDMPINYDKSTDCTINPIGPGCVLCKDPFALSPKCGCNPESPVFDSFKNQCSTMIANKCKTDSKGPGCPGNCEEPDPTKIDKSCYCHPDNSRFFLVKNQCVEYATRQDIDFLGKVKDMRGSLANQINTTKDSYTQHVAGGKESSGYASFDPNLVLDCTSNPLGPGCSPLCADFSQLDPTCQCDPKNAEYTTYKTACNNLKAANVITKRDEIDCTDPLKNINCTCNPKNPAYDKTQCKTIAPSTTTQIDANMQQIGSIVAIGLVIFVVGLLIYLLYKAFLRK